MKKLKKKQKKTYLPTLRQLENIIFRTMRIEHSDMTRDIARKAAAKIRIPR